MKKELVEAYVASWIEIDVVLADDFEEESRLT